MRPSNPEVELVVSPGKFVSGGDSEDVVRAGRLVSAGDSEDVVVSLAVEASFDVSTLLDVFDGAAVEVADVSDKAGNLGACASTFVIGKAANRNKNSRLGDGRIAGKMKEDI